MIGPFIDTIVVCTMTVLTLLITESHIDPTTGKPFVEEVVGDVNMFGTFSGTVRVSHRGCCVVVNVEDEGCGWVWGEVEGGGRCLSCVFGF